MPIIPFSIIFYLFLKEQSEGEKVKKMVEYTSLEAPTIPGRLRRLVAFMILSTFAYAVLLPIRAFSPLFVADHFGVSVKTAAAFLSIS